MNFGRLQTFADGYKMVGQMFQRSKTSLIKPCVSLIILYDHFYYIGQKPFLLCNIAVMALANRFTALILMLRMTSN